MPSRSVLAVVLLAAIGLVAAACGSGDPGLGLGPLGPTTTTTTGGTDPDGTDPDGTDPDGQDPDGQDPDGTVVWSEPDARGFESATLQVPLDHDDPSAGTIDLALVRRPASDPDRRIGSLLVNPGGPGASGIDWARQAPRLFPDALLERFDLIGFDPRGVGASAAVACLDDDSLDRYLALDPAPDDQAELAEIEAATAELVAACQANTEAGLLEHVSTEDAARDMDLIRQAVGDERLTYLGGSYGSELGAVYADLFPDRVRALVLDGASPPELTRAEITEGQAVGFEQALRRFFEWCDRSASCRFAAGRSAATAFDEIMASIDAKPLVAESSGDPRPVTVGYAWTGVLATLYSEQAWPALGEALTGAEAGDGSLLQLFADSYAFRDEDGAYQNVLAANLAISCLDDPAIDAAALSELQGRLARLAPRVGPVLTGATDPCAQWPHQPTAVRAAPTATGAPPILVVTTTGDPATPYEWGLQLAEDLESGVLVVNRAEGHTGFATGSRCIDDLVTAYLVDLDVPEYGATCG
ncbi:MAG: alpha/beta fold hydrolase [Acidimicrobiales bacterium]|nr:alpha/beta fold hydrolase [Acidimicrobiales bacterium]